MGLPLSENDAWTTSLEHRDRQSVPNGSTGWPKLAKLFGQIAVADSVQEGGILGFGKRLGLQRCCPNNSTRPRRERRQSVENSLR